MEKYHTIEAIRFEEDLVLLSIDGIEKKFKTSDVSLSLAQATELEKNTFEISPSGYGIHWPLLDEDISIDGLLGISHTPNQIERSA